MSRMRGLHNTLHIGHRFIVSVAASLYAARP